MSPGGRQQYLGAMKTFTPFRGSLLRLAFMTTAIFGAMAAAVVMAQAPAEREEPAGQRPAPEPNVGGGGDAREITPGDRQFLMRAASLIATEISLSDVATQQAVRADVQRLANACIQAHRRLAAQLRSFASERGVSIPEGDRDESAVARLAFLKADVFDRTYVVEVSNVHLDTIALFENAAREAADPDLKAFAANAVAELKTRFAEAKVVRQAVE